MPLRWQTIELPLVGGRNKKIAEEVLQGPALAELQDADVSEVGAIKPRAPYSALTLTEVCGGASPFDSYRLAKYEDNLLILNQKDTLYKYLKSENETAVAPSGEGFAYLANSSRKTLFATGRGDHLFPDIAIAGNYIVATFLGYVEDSPPAAARVRWAVLEKDSYQLVAQGFFSDSAASGTGARLVAIGNEVFAFFRNTAGTAINHTKLDVSTDPCAWSTVTASAGTNHATGFHFDATTDGTSLFLVRCTDIGRLEFKKFNTSLTETASNTVISELEAGAIAVNYCTQAAAVYCVIYVDEDPDAINIHKTDTNLTTITSASIVTLLPVAPVNAYVEDAASGKLVVFAEIGTGLTKTLEIYEINDDLTSPLLKKEVADLSLSHKAVRESDRAILVGVTYGHELSTERRYMTLKITPSDLRVVEPVATYSHRLAGEYVENSHISHFLPDGTSYRWAGVLRNLLKVDGALQHGHDSLTEYKFERARAEMGRSVHANGVTYFAGSYPAIYAGGDLIDWGFLAPPLVEVNPTTGGSLTSSTTYTYQVVFYWVDERGNVWRSAPSLPVVATMGGSDTAVTVSWQARYSRYAKLFLAAVYRSEAGVSESLYESILDTLPTNQFIVGATSGSVLDIRSDATLVSQPLIYTTGGVLENHAPPPCRVIEKHQDRIFVVSDEDGAIWPSFEITDREGVAFHSDLRVRTFEHGKPVALKSMDTVLAVLWPDKVGVLQGRGLDRLGQGQQYQTHILPGGEGCSEPSSVIEIPAGVLYKSPRGFRLLGRDLQIRAIGTEVSDYDSQAVVSADLVETQHEVRFTLGDTGGTVLVYEYQQNRWSIYTETVGASDDAVDATVMDGRHVILDDNSTIVQQDASGEVTDMEFVTGWIKPGGLRGAIRVRRGWFRGDFSGAGRLTVSFGYDFADTYEFTRTIFSPGIKDIRIDFPRQRCEAFRLKLAGAKEVHAIRLEFGVKRGGAKAVDGVPTT